MTYEQFQATRTMVPDLGASTDNEALDGRPGFLYEGGLCIETRCADWAGSPAAAHEFLLVIGNQEWVSDDLGDLETRLFDYALSEGLVE